MKKLVFLLYLVMLIILLTGCTLATEGVTITKYPDRLIYIAGYDTELDLTGGEVEFLFSDKSTRIYSMYDNLPTLRISHEIDFNIPGVYIVKINNYKNDDSFAIQVVEADYIDNIISQKLEFE